MGFFIEGYDGNLWGLVILQVEAQEATINEVSRLCDTVEAICDAEEHRLKEPLFDLPIWEPSCEELMTSLQTEE